MKSLKTIIEKKAWVGWLLFCVTAAVVFGLGLLASSIMERRAEAVFAYKPQVEYSQFEPRSRIWGENFPRQYETYARTADTTFRSKYNGNAMIDMLEVDPRLVVLWAGYGFSKDYNQGRGHFYAVSDVWNTLRTGAPVASRKSPMPNTCWTCKSPDVPRVMNDIGIAAFYQGSWEEKGPEIINAVGCADCHDAKTMDLRITRPALIEAFSRRGEDVTKATHQQMRSLVCAQCHVEYYFNTNNPERIPYLTFPWDNGTSVDEVEVYYDNMKFADWVHSLSRAPMIKAQHPGYEIYLTGVHADRGVSCADCHMPYRSEGGQKFTDHKIQSPLNNIAASCQVCHREETTTLIENVYQRQDKIIETRDTLEELLVRAHVEAEKAWSLGASESEMNTALIRIRHAQWRWDYAAAAHGNSFHSPVETLRIISTGIAKVQDARILLSRILAAHGFNEAVPYPDISTKAKAQAFIGLAAADLQTEKNEFVKIVIPVWEKQAAERESEY